MRIAFLTWRDTTHPDGGGSEVFVEETALRLARRGHQVTIVCARHGTAEHRSRLGPVTILRTGGRLTVYPRALLWAWRRRRRLDAVVDVVNGLPFATPLIRRHGVTALVHHVHREQWRMIYPGLAGRVGWFVESVVTPRLYRRVPFVTVSEASREDLVRLGVPRRAVTVVRNGSQAPDPGASGRIHERSPVPRVAVLARLVPHKQIEHVMRLAAQLAPELPGLEVDVVGEGWWRPELEAERDRLGVADRVHLHGWLPEPERDRILARAWVQVLPSVKEGWGLAVMEAAAVGTPTVAYASAGGLAESVVDGVTGALARDYDELAELTRRLLLDTRSREEMGRRAVARAATFTWESTTEALEEVLASSVRTGRRRPGPAGTPG